MKKCLYTAKYSNKNILGGGRSGNQFGYDLIKQGNIWNVDNLKHIFKILFCLF